MPPPDPPISAPTPPLDASGRYEDRWLVGRGGMGEVRLVYDRRLRRTAVMKIVRPELAGTRAARRLAVEAEITARLQHPGVVPVYDAGALPDGRPFYVMREVRGQTLAEVIGAVHGASPPGEWRAAEGWTFRRLVDALRRVCETVAYAHTHGVVHRDLKPANVMLEGLGAVLVLDWGIAKLVGPAEEAQPRRAVLDAAAGTIALEEPEGESGSLAPAGTLVFEPPVESPREWSGGTAVGAVLGTRGFMAPEQARGDALGPPADVYALGATLHVLLFGALPDDAVGGTRADPRVPDALDQLARRAMATCPEDRPTAVEVAADIGAWLDGVRRREEALALVAQADELRPTILADRARAATLRADARRRLAQVAAHAPAADKVEAWRLEDEAEQLVTHAVAREEAWTQLLHAALQIVDLPEAHARLADHYRERHAAAESARDRATATRAELRLRAHDRGRHAAWLRGDATLTLATDPPGAEVTLFRNVLRDRALVPEPVGRLGRAPLTRAPIPWGSLLLRVEGPAGAVDLPILVGRAEDWQLAPPDRAPIPLWLPRPGELGADDVYVPAGWFRAGGDPHAGDALPAGPRWLESFVIRRYPVTNAEYLAFLNDLVAAGRVEAAEAHAPRRGEGAEQEAGECFYGRRPDDGFCLASAGPGADWALDEPVTSVCWHDARAFAAWEAARTGQPWRLPHELEWEKAARGVDGRFLPWGDFFEPSWANNLEGVVRPPRRMPTTSFPTDASPYGVRGMAGNVRDWCANTWREGTDPGDPEAFVSLRGGAFSGNRNNCRVATRFAAPPGRRYTQVGFRLARPTGS